MTYGPPPNQGWQPPPPPGYHPPPGHGPRKPPLPGVVVLLGIVAILWGLYSGIFFRGLISAVAIKMAVALLGLVGGIMVLSRVRAGAILLAVAGGLSTLGFVGSFFTRYLGRGVHLNEFFSIGEDGLVLLQGLVGIAVLVLSLSPQVTAALSGASPQRPPGPQPPPGFAPPPPGHGPRPPQPPPNWR